MYYNFKKCYSWYISSESFMVDLLWLLMTDESSCSVYWITQPLKMQFVEALQKCWKCLSLVQKLDIKLYIHFDYYCYYSGITKNWKEIYQKQLLRRWIYISFKKFFFFSELLYLSILLIKNKCTDTRINYFNIYWKSSNVLVCYREIKFIS